MRPVPVRRPPAGSSPLAFRAVVEALTITGAVFAGVGLLLFGLGIALTRSNRGFERGAQRAPGRIAGIRWETIGLPGDREMVGFPELRFEDPLP